LNRGRNTKSHFFYRIVKFECFSIYDFLLRILALEKFEMLAVQKDERQGLKASREEKVCF